jgi:hypothetical protein
MRNEVGCARDQVARKQRSQNQFGFHNFNIVQCSPADVIAASKVCKKIV